MQHRDYITIGKIVDEMEIGIRLLGNTELGNFLEDEMLKGALGMICIDEREHV